MAGNSKVDQIEKEKRIYQVSLLLRRKPIRFIIQFITEKWGIEERQAYNYIRLARLEWRKYFEKLKGDGIAYHIAQMRDMKDIAYNERDYRLMFEIAKEEAKLMGIYPATKLEVTDKKIVVIGKNKEKDDNEKCKKP